MQSKNVSLLMFSWTIDMLFITKKYNTAIELYPTSSFNTVYACITSGLPYIFFNEGLILIRITGHSDFFNQSVFTLRHVSCTQKLWHERGTWEKIVCSVHLKMVSWRCMYVCICSSVFVIDSVNEGLFFQFFAGTGLSSCCVADFSHRSGFSGHSMWDK